MKFGIPLFCLLLFANFLKADIVKNQDLPVKGQWQFSPRKVWEIDSAGKEILVDIPCIRMDERGNIFILDGRLNKIHVFNPDGKHNFSFAQKGEGPGEIKYAGKFYMYEKKIIVPDGGKIHYFTVTGEYKKSIKTSEWLIDYLFLNEYRLVAVPFSSIVSRGKIKPIDVFLFNLKSNEKKKLFQLPPVKALRYSGGGLRFMLRMPRDVEERLIMAMSPQGIFYGYSNTYTIHKLDYSGKELLTFTIEGRQRQKLSQKERRIALEKVAQKNNDIPKNVMNKMADQIPHLLPYFHNLHTDGTGLIYVLTSSINNPGKKDVDIFSERGEYLYRGFLNLDKNYVFIRFAIRKNDLIVFLEDSEGEIKLVKYFINIPESVQ